MKLNALIISIPIRHACLVTGCRNPAGEDGFCKTCRSCLPKHRRDKLIRKPGKIRKWVTVRLAVKHVHHQHQRRGRN